MTTTTRSGGYLATLITDVALGRVTDTIEAKLRAETWRQAEHLLATGTTPPDVADVMHRDLDAVCAEITDTISESGADQDDDVDAWIQDTKAIVRAAIAEVRTHTVNAVPVIIPGQATGERPVGVLDRVDRDRLAYDSTALELYDELDRVDDELRDEHNTAWYEQLQLRTELYERDARLASESATRTTTELTRQIAVGRADVARCDSKALGLASMVSLVGAGVGAVITLTGATARLGAATAITGGLAAVAALVVLVLAAAVMWPASRKRAVVVDPTTVTSLNLGLTVERDQVHALGDRKFTFLRYALVALAVTAGLALAAIATTIGA